MMSRLFEDMIEFVIEEADDSEKYAKLALKLKDTHPDLAKMFEEMSADEYKHMSKLCEHMTKLAQEYEKNMIPQDMAQVFNYLRKGMLKEKSMLIKHLHGMYSGT